MGLGSGGVGFGKLGGIAAGVASVYIGGQAYRNGVSVVKAKLTEKDKRNIPKKDLRDKDHIDTSKFTKKVRGQDAWEDPKTGYRVSKDTSKHGGSDKKLEDSSKRHNRVASLSKSGKILRH